MIVGDFDEMQVLQELSIDYHSLSVVTGVEEGRSLSRRKITSDSQLSFSYQF